MRVGFKQLEELWSQVDFYTYSLWDPEVYGPGPSRVFRYVFKASIATSIATFAIATLAVLAGLLSPLALLLPLIPPIASLKAPTVWRLILGSGVDKELPAVLAYLIPYTRSPINIADLIASLEGESYFWVRFEASRLRFLLNLGYDPITALTKLAETTPSRALAEVIRDYVNTQSLGVSRSQLTLLLFRHAMDSVRSQWRSHIEFGRLVAEGIVAALVSMVALTPLILLGGGYPAILLIIPLVVAPAGALAMIATRPSLGEYRLSYFELLLTLTVPVVAIMLNLKVSLDAGLAYLVGMTIVVEAIALGFKRLNSMALIELRRAVEEARLGLLPEERMARAEKAAGGVLKSIVEASRVAGTMGLGEALNQILTLVEEARRHVKEASTQAAILALLSSVSIPITIYALGILKTSLAIGNLNMVNPEAVDSLARLLAATSPLIALPASILQRGWLISPIYPLIAQTLAMITLSLI